MFPYTFDDFSILSVIFTLSIDHAIIERSNIFFLVDYSKLSFSLHFALVKLA